MALLGQTAFAKAMAGVANDNAAERLAGSVGRTHGPPALLGQRLKTDGARLFVKVGDVGVAGAAVDLSSSSAMRFAHSRHDLVALLLHACSLMESET